MGTVQAMWAAWPGETVQKVGRTTGRTQGTVQHTCRAVDFFDLDGSPTDITLLCQGEANYASSAGDSGSPVVQVYSGGLVFAIGIHWRGGNPTRIFSHLDLVLWELGGAFGGTLSPISIGQ
jgi:hypothetical protein